MTGGSFSTGRSSAIIDRFATHKILDLTFGDADHVRALRGSAKCSSRRAQTVRLKVPRAQVSETCRAMLTTCKVTDISVQEPPVEEVIRQLFNEQAGVEQGTARESARPSVTA